MEYVIIAAIGIIVFIVARFVLNLNSEKIASLILNIVSGVFALWLVNNYGSNIGLHIHIPINYITAIVVGLTGLPGVIVLAILNVLGVL